MDVMWQMWCYKQLWCYKEHVNVLCFAEDQFPRPLRHHLWVLLPVLMLICVVVCVVVCVVIGVVIGVVIVVVIGEYAVSLGCSSWYEVCSNSRLTLFSPTCRKTKLNHLMETKNWLSLKQRTSEALSKHYHAITITHTFFYYESFIMEFLLEFYYGVMDYRVVFV